MLDVMVECTRLRADPFARSRLLPKGQACAVPTATGGCFEDVPRYQASVAQPFCKYDLHTAIAELVHGTEWRVCEQGGGISVLELVVAVLATPQGGPVYDELVVRGVGVN
eukprot:13480212-Alexandrium_andersonii.AAC.1